MRVLVLWLGMHDGAQSIWLSATLAPCGCELARIALASVDKKPRNKWRGHFAYLFNKAVGGKMDQGIIAVWYAWITAESGSTIYGNNPLNLTCSKGDGCYPGQIGHYRFAGNSRNFAAFATPQDGANAVARLLTIRQYRYPAITLAAQRGDWQAMADAISKSCWVSCARPGYVRNGVNSLYSIWNGLRATVAAEFAALPKGAPGAVIPSVPPDAVPRTGGTTYTAEQWNAFIACLSLPSPNRNSPYVIRVEDVPKILACATSNRINLTSAQIVPFYGKTLSDLRDSLAAEGTIPGANPVPEPLQGLADALATIVGFIAKLFDPQTYVRTGALLLGLILALTGFKMLIDASSGGAPVA